MNRAERVQQARKLMPAPAGINASLAGFVEALARWSLRQHYVRQIAGEATMKSGNIRPLQQRPSD